MKTAKKPAKRKPVERERDPRVVEIMATFDTIASHWSRHDNDGYTETFMEHVLGLEWRHWTDAAYRAVLRVALLEAPNEDVDDMLNVSRAEAENFVLHRLTYVYEELCGRCSADDAFEIVLSTVREFERSLGREATKEELVRFCEAAPSSAAAKAKAA